MQVGAVVDELPRARAALASAYVVLPGYTKERDDEQKFMEMAEQSARQALARERGISSGKDGIGATIAMHRKDWVEAKRLLQQQTEVPDELKPQLGHSDLVFKIMNESLDDDRMAWIHQWDVMHLWTPEARAMRKDPRFPALVERLGLVDYWKQYGYPDGCVAGAGGRSIACAS